MRPPRIGDILYRYETQECHLTEWEVTRITPCGYWVKQHWAGSFFKSGGPEKFILAGARKKFAHEKQIDALRAYLARRARYRNILQAAMLNCMAGIWEAEAKLREMDGVAM